MKVYWCDKCNTPIIYSSIINYEIKLDEDQLEVEEFFDLERDKRPLIVECPLCQNKTKYIASDIRPVFMPERILLSVLTGVDYTEKHIWNSVGQGYFVDGIKADIQIGNLYQIPNLSELIEPINIQIKENKKNVDFENFIKANHIHYKAIDTMTMDFIKQVIEKYKKRLPLVSFSGGKDSTVVSDLVVRATNNINILHVFGDTTLEFPFTYEYLERIKERPQRPPFLPIDEPVNDFEGLVEDFGPPSRVMRWCCTIYKTGPIGNLFRQMSDQTPILTFYGVRRSESNARSMYEPITLSPKIKQQIVVSPVLKWYDIDVWLYILTRGIDFNDAYKLGFARVGCWCCPNNSDWSEFLCKIFMQEKADKWRNFLVGFATKIGKPDPEEYVDEGGWKARQGGQGLDTGVLELESKPCVLEEDVKNYSLNRPINDSLYEFFKPFGVISQRREMLGEVYLLDPKTKEPLFVLQGNKGRKELKVKLLTSKNKLLLSQRIECQLRKYQFCISCSACTNVCPFGAISLIKGYKIDEVKCTHCMKCIAYYHKGCLVTKVMVDY